jgi:predicted metal-binding protein
MTGKDGTLRQEQRERALSQVLALGATHAAMLLVDQIVFEPSYRTLCEQNACGMYGKNWMCPPDVGEVHTLIAQAKRYRQALVYQLIESLEDSYDIEGMLRAGKRMNDLVQRVRRTLCPLLGNDALYLGAGGCRLCAACAKRDDVPCRHPDLAVASLEAYGVDVSRLAPLAGMRYINGENTVTYFAAVLFDRRDNA